MSASRPTLVYLLAIAAAATIAAPCLWAQSSGPPRGTLVLAGGAYGPGVIDRFRAAAGGPAASVVYIPSASSGIRLPSGLIWIPPEESDATANLAEFTAALRALFGVREVIVLHSRDRAAWDRDAFTAPLRSTTAVWLSEGNAGRLTGLVLGTRAETAIRDVLARDGVVGGTSAGAIVAGSTILRGRSDKPVVVARGFDRGLGLLANVAINPHLAEAKRENELVGVVDAQPSLLGIGLDEYAAVVVRGNRAEVIGAGRAAIYDDQPHGKTWFYYLAPGAVFDLAARREAPHY